MCSSTRGPAKAPSLVTCPTKNRAHPAALAAPASSAAHWRTWPTEPGALLNSSLLRAWMLSTTTAVVGVGGHGLEDGLQGGVGQQLHALAGQAQAVGPSPTWRADSSAATYSTRPPFRAPRAWAVCSIRVDLPMPGSPPTSTTMPATRPPPKTRSSSGRPVGRRFSGRSRAWFRESCAPARRAVFYLPGPPAPPPGCPSFGRRGNAPTIWAGPPRSF